MFCHWLNGVQPALFQKCVEGCAVLLNPGEQAVRSFGGSIGATALQNCENGHGS